MRAWHILSLLLWSGCQPEGVLTDPGRSTRDQVCRAVYRYLEQEWRDLRPEDATLEAVELVSCDRPQTRDGQGEVEAVVSWTYAPATLGRSWTRTTTIRCQLTRWDQGWEVDVCVTVEQ